MNAQGASVTTLPGYKLWVDDVNKKGGLLIKEFNKRIPIEVVEYDDTSNAEAAVRLVERLMTQDKVDFVLPPWSTGFNLATAPVFARNGYPQLAVTANSNEATALVKQMPTLFFFLNEPRNFGEALGQALSKLKSENKINNKIAMLSVAHQFGAELTSGVTPVLQQAGFEFVLRKTYPLGSADLTNEIKEAKASDADTFIAYSYPPDTFMLTNTAVTQGYNPKVFHLGVGTSFSRYAANFKEKANGVLGIGGWDPAVPGAQDYVKRLTAIDQPGRRWLGRAGDVCEPAGPGAGDREGRHARPQEGARRHRERRTIRDHRGADRSQDSHPRQAVRNGTVAERRIRRHRAHRSAWRQADRFPEAGVVTTADKQPALVLRSRCPPPLPPRKSGIEGSLHSGVSKDADRDASSLSRKPRAMLLMHRDNIAARKFAAIAHMQHEGSH